MNFSQNIKKILQKIRKRVTKQFKQISFIEKYADHIIGYYFTFHFLTKKFIDYFFIGNIGILTDSKEEINTEKLKSEKIRILHAPSNPIHKGTEKIRKIIQKLKTKYPFIEYIEITSKTNKEVIENIKKCDFVIDQLYSDTPMGFLALEASIYNKPSIVGGYIWEEFTKIYPSEINTSNLFMPSR